MEGLHLGTESHLCYMFMQKQSWSKRKNKACPF